MFLLVDNYDSFTYNLWHFLGQLGAEVKVCRNDKITVAQALALKPDGIIISPGPCDPSRAGVCLELIEKSPNNIPIFGVCLGHQCIGQAFGGTIVKSSRPMHGKISKVHHSNKDIFENIPQNFFATRYHSLVVERDSLPSSLNISAETEDGLIMGLAHKTRPVFGVQFHPESIASEYGYLLLSNFLKTTGRKTVSLKAIKVLQENLRKTC
jgi:anthranilate synthase component 2